MSVDRDTPDLELIERARSGSLDAHVSIWNVDGQQTLVFLAEGELEGTGAGQTGDVIDGTHDTLAVGHATNDVPIN